tara:strand:+ start:7902 stop:8558 length:657 start_codon:yes stop_codon:yes gene_type:complete
MNVIVFFSQSHKLLEYANLAAPYNVKDISFHFISTTLISEAEKTMLHDNKIEFIETENIDLAFDQASEKVGKSECVITVADVMPKDQWLETIHKEKAILTDMGCAIGRWYKTLKPGREHLKLSKLGAKYIDHTPELIRNHVIDHSPSMLVHAKKISRFPVFFNWFSEGMSQAIANCLKVSCSFSDFSHFLSDEMCRVESNESIYYINSLEIIDLKLLN